MISPDPIRRSDVTQYRIVAQTRVDPWMAEHERKYAEHCVHSDLARAIADRILKEHKPLVTHPQPLSEVHTIDLYVFTPAQFLVEVRREAKRWQYLAAQYPGFTP